jgi:hypothetical protein
MWLAARSEFFLMPTHGNPYEAPTAHVEDVHTPESDSAEAIRREHLQHEASVRSIGTIYLMASSVWGLLAGVILVQIFQDLDAGRFYDSFYGSAGFVLLPVASFAIGLGLRRLRPWTRIPAIVLSCLGLLWIPFGTLLHGYFLYLLFAAKGKRVLGPEYAAIVAATPHIEHRTSIATWIFLGLLLLFLIMSVVIGMLWRT